MEFYQGSLPGHHVVKQNKLSHEVKCSDQNGIEFYFCEK